MALLSATTALSETVTTRNADYQIVQAYPEQPPLKNPSCTTYPEAQCPPDWVNLHSWSFTEVASYGGVDAAGSGFITINCVTNAICQAPALFQCVAGQCVPSTTGLPKASCEAACSGSALGYA